MSRETGRDGGRVRIPADIDRPDRILAGLTAHQLAILAVATVALWAGYLALHRLVPLALYGAAATPLVVAAIVLALGKRDGLSADRLVLAAFRLARGPRRFVPAPDAVPPVPVWAGTDPARPPAPLDPPARGVDDGGVIDLGGDGRALICQASAINLALRTPAEQQAILASFGRWLNSLTAPVQLLIRSRTADLSAMVRDLREAAGGLPHPALETAALAHTDYLDSLAANRDLLTRQVLLVLREPAGADGAAARLRRRAEDAAQALAATGVRVAVLDQKAAGEVLRSALDPWSPPPPAGLADDDVVTAGAE